MVALQTRAQAELERRRRKKEETERYPKLAEQLAEGLTDWAQPLLAPYRYKCLWGGRGSGKSVASSDCLLIIGLTRKIRVLCAREFQNSIKDSVHALLKERIAALGLEGFYTVTRESIVGKNGSNFIFKGVRCNVQSIKSMSGLTHCWIEEGQTISADSWQVLVPTIRAEGSEIWVTFNPLNESDVVYQELVAATRENAYVERVNWDRNPHFPSVLDDERRHMQATDPDAYQHIWEGGFWEQSDAQILRGKYFIEEFEPDSSFGSPLHGADFGFAQDPTTLIRCYVRGNMLYISHESYAVGLEIDDTAARWADDIPGSEQYIIRGDSARPETISYLRRNGMPRIESVKKWSGSVEDGIAFLRSFEKIVIHPRCKHTIEEARLYSYKTDRLSGDVLPVVADNWNHAIDGLRYALAPAILARGAAKKSGLKLY